MKGTETGDLDKIIIEDLEVYAYHGVAAEEKALGQLFYISLVIYADLGAAASNGNLEETINYAKVCDAAVDVLCSAKYDLIETAALKVIEEIFRKFPLAAAVRVTLKKPWAPLGRHLKHAAVELTRVRENI